MKAVAVFPANKQVRLIDHHPEPRIETPGQVKLKILDVGICGTDKEIISFEYGDPPDGSDYLVIGHESFGEVVEVGPEVVDVKPGDMGVFSVRRPCPHPHCTACRAWRQDFCYTGDFTERGIQGLHGFMTEFVVDGARFFNKAPAELRDVAVLVEPLTIAEKAVIQLWEVQQRLPWACPSDPSKPGGAGWCHKALVLGAGPVGLLGAMKMVREGFQTFIYSRVGGIEVRREIAKAIGAEFIDAEEVPASEIQGIVGNIDVVYEAVGASHLAFEVLAALGTNGVFIFTGVPGRREPIPVDTAGLMKDLVLRNQMVYGTVNAGPEAFRDAIADLAIFQQRWPAALTAMITNRLPVERALEPLCGKMHGIKNVVQFS